MKQLVQLIENWKFGVALILVLAISYVCAGLVVAVPLTLLDELGIYHYGNTESLIYAGLLTPLFLGSRIVRDGLADVLKKSKTQQPAR